MKKRALWLLIAVACITLLLTVTATAASGTCGDKLKWTLDSYGVLTVSGEGKMTDWSLYDTNAPWYSYHTSVKKVVIKSGVTSIGDYAFEWCTSLTSITIPDSVTSIGSWAFYNCTSLTSITIPDSVTSIGSWAFSNCTSLTSITLPDSLTSIGHRAFENCTSLTSITIPDSVTSIGYNAFYNCTSLTSITIPDSVTSIGEYAFYNTAYYNNTSNWTNNVLYIDNHLIEAKTAISGKYSIREGTKTIAAFAFYNCTSLTSITLPDSVTSIGSDAFYNCTKLTSVTIPDSVTSIATRAFYYCTKLTSVTIPNGVTYIGFSAFSGCTSLTSITIPNGVTSISQYTFSGCTSLTSITLPDSLTSINHWAFENCTSLTSITVPNSVTEIKQYAMGYTDDLRRIAGFTINGCIGSAAHVYADNNGITFIPNKDVSGTWGDNITWTLNIDGVLTISGEGAMLDGAADALPTWLSYTAYVKTVKISPNITTIGKYAFYKASNLKSIVIPMNITKISDYAFYDCEGLKEVTFEGGSQTKSLGYAAFRQCTSLKSITVPTSVTSFGSRALGYYSDGTSLKILDGFTIYAEKGSKAETYANANGIPFVAICAHKYSAVVTPPTCTEEGYTTYTCSDCGDSYVGDKTDVKEHSYNKAVTLPTCTEEGYTTYTCSDCGDSYVGDKTDVKEHSYNKVVTAPTCTEEGYTTYTCSDCDDCYIDDETEATGHSFGNWITDVEPTYEKEGSKHRVCNACGETETATIPVLEIMYSTFTIEDAHVMPGDSFKVTLSLNTTCEINSIALYEMEYDTDVLEFIGFGDYEAIEELSVFAPSFDTETGYMLIALSESMKFNGDICTLEFKVKETATDTITRISAKSLVKNDSQVIESDVKASEISVNTYVLGDINGDGNVDIDDATYLFGHTMLPEYFPMEYKGDMDFVKDGHLDIKDAVYLFNYSMLPEIYPIV